ncbi:hypothetical protein DFS34DRAFT_61219 [Phlyctochytrium arcticum]|nr:hypothetical protein DFS34DRAFT_61219 [Phlyctochytrium arcticum]
MDSTSSWSILEGRLSLTRRLDESEPATHYTAGAYMRGLFLLAFLGTVLYGAYLFLRWRRRKQGHAFSGSRGFLSGFTRGGASNVTPDRGGYDPLANQSFAFDEELDLELNAYDFGGTGGGHPFGGVKLRPGGVGGAAPFRDVGVARNGPKSGRSETPSARRISGTGTETPLRLTPLDVGSGEVEDADELLRWAEANIPSPNSARP